MGSNKVEVDENDSNKHNLGTTHHIVSRKTNPEFSPTRFFVAFGKRCKKKLSPHVGVMSSVTGSVEGGVREATTLVHAGGTRHTAHCTAHCTLHTAHCTAHCTLHTEVQK